MNKKDNNYTYILKCNDNTLYTGWTNSLENRILAHNLKKGAKYTKNRLPAYLVYYEIFETKVDAMKREYEIKHLSRKEKEDIISKMKGKKKKAFCEDINKKIVKLGEEDVKK